RATYRGDVAVAASAQQSRRWVWVIVGMTLGPSLADSRLAPAQSPSEIAHLRTELHDKSPTKRKYAAGALGRIGPEAKAAAHELARLLKDPDAGVRQAAAEALGRTEPTTATVVELSRLLKDPEAGVRTSAVFALGAIGPEAKAAVIDIIKLL